MTKEQVSNFNFKAFISLAGKHPEIKKEIESLGYDIAKMQYINEIALEDLHGKFKFALLKVYRKFFEEETPTDELVKEFTALCKVYKTTKGKNFQREIRNLEAEMCDEVESQLKRIGKTFTRNNDTLEFMGYSTTEEIKEINSESEITFYNISEPISFRSAVDNGDINLYDVASLIDELRDM